MDDEKNQNDSSSSNEGNQNNFQRQMYQGDWKCSKCSGKITQLPFEPDPARLDQLQCRDCYRKNRPPSRDRY